jgi:hypothetical protein
LIARVQSTETWFALTPSHLVSSVDGLVRRVSLTDINGFAPRLEQLAELVERNRSGGMLELSSKDGRIVELSIEAGKPFVGLLNVFIYIVKTNRSANAGNA